MSLWRRVEEARATPNGGRSPWAPPAAEELSEPGPPSGAVEPASEAVAPPPRSGARLADRAPAPAAAPPVRSDALGTLKASAVETLFTRLGARLNDPDLDEASLRSLVVEELNSVIEEAKVPLSSAERQRLLREVEADVLGLGPLESLLADDSVTEIMVNGPHSVYVEREGRIHRTAAFFDGEPHLRRTIERIVTRVGRRIDESSPLVDARLEDGSRVNAIIPPLAVSGSTLTIRKFSRDALSVEDLARLGTMPPEMAELMRACVEARLNILISGGTGTGKTTLLNVLSSYIPNSDRIISIEDSVELQLQQDHVVRLESRPPNIEGRGEVTIRDLVRNALRMRPDRIVVGEVRGAEALDMLQAMNTGHDGSLSTVHSNSPRDCLSRLETLVMMAGVELPLRAIREQVSSAVDLIVHLSRLHDGTRRITAVTEVHGMEGQTITTQDVYLFDYSAGVDANGRFRGRTVPTGVRPSFTDRFQDLGIQISPAAFGGEDWGLFK